MVNDAKMIEFMGIIKARINGLEIVNNEFMLPIRYLVEKYNEVVATQKAGGTVSNSVLQSLKDCFYIYASMLIDNQTDNHEKRNSEKQLVRDFLEEIFVISTSERTDIAVLNEPQKPDSEIEDISDIQFTEEQRVNSDSEFENTHENNNNIEDVEFENEESSGFEISEEEIPDEFK